MRIFLLSQVGIEHLDVKPHALYPGFVTECRYLALDVVCRNSVIQFDLEQLSRSQAILPVLHLPVGLPVPDLSCHGR
jgi:hypothetical protein